MKNRTQPDEAAIKLAAALLHLEEAKKWRLGGKKGLPRTQAAIADHLTAGLGKRVSQSTISRWLRATENEYWRWEIAELRDRTNADSELLRQAREIAYRENLVDKVRQRLPSAAAGRLRAIHAVPNLDSTQKQDYDAFITAFALGAAGKMAELLERGALWGVTWGRNLGAVLTQLVGDPTHRENIPRVPKVVPLCGDPFDVLSTRDSSSVLAEQLQVYLHGGRPRDVLSLRNVPAYIPESSAGFSEPEIRGIKKLMHRCQAYQQIFGTARLAADDRSQRKLVGVPMADRLDGIITSLSSEGRTFGYGSAQMLPVTKREKDWLDLNAFDIGGVCLHRSPNGRAGTELMERIRGRWTGITYQQLDACAERASKGAGPDAPPGVVVIAAEVKKVSAIASSLRLGLINQLICSASVAKQLEEKLV